MANTMVAPQKLNKELSLDLAIPLLGIYTEGLKGGAWTDICILMFVTALFTIAKGRNNPNF